MLQNMIAFNKSLAGLSSSQKGQKVMDAGYVNSKGKPAWTAYYSDVLYEMENSEEYKKEMEEKYIQETAELMIHYVNRHFRPHYNVQAFSAYWADYADAVDHFGIDAVDR